MDGVWNRIKGNRLSCFENLCSVKFLPSRNRHLPLHEFLGSDYRYVANVAFVELLLSHWMSRKKFGDSADFG